MTRLLVSSVSLLLLVLLMTGCTSQPPVTPTPAAEKEAPAGIQIRGQDGRQVIAEGRVVPTRSAALSLPSAGVVISVPVTLGQQVAAGQVPGATRYPAVSTAGTSRRRRLTSPPRRPS